MFYLIVKVTATNKLRKTSQLIRKISHFSSKTNVMLVSNIIHSLKSMSILQLIIHRNLMLLQLPTNIIHSLKNMSILQLIIQRNLLRFQLPTSDVKK